MPNTNITTIRTYNLVDSNGNRLQLKLGRINVSRDVRRVGPDQGFRWNFKGTKIPMPVRSETWFNGFPEETMLNWLKANGWYPRTIVYYDNTVQVCELPKANEEKPTSTDRSSLLPVFQDSFEDAIRALYDVSYVKAVNAYLYAHGGTVRRAREAVAKICGKEV